MRRFSKSCWIILFALAMASCKSGDSAPPASSDATSATPTAAAASPTVAAASASPSSSPVSSSAATIDPCALLTSDELKAAQGEELKQASRSDQQDPDYVITQCYYLLPTAVNSVVINLTTQKSGGKTAKELWKKLFQESKENDEGAEGEKAAKPEKVSALGEEALWIGSRVGGALYVLKKDMIFRISVGGAADMKTKLARSKTLAAKALARIK